MILVAALAASEGSQGCEDAKREHPWKKEAWRICAALAAPDGRHFLCR